MWNADQDFYDFMAQKTVSVLVIVPNRPSASGFHAQIMLSKRRRLGGFRSSDAVLHSENPSIRLMWRYRSLIILLFARWCHWHERCTCVVVSLPRVSQIVPTVIKNNLATTAKCIADALLSSLWECYIVTLFTDIYLTMLFLVWQRFVCYFMMR